MSMLRQVVLIRTDLGFSTGLMAAQVAHIHMERFRQMIIDKKSVGEFSQDREWISAPYIFVHGIPCKEVLEEFVKKAEEAKVPVSKWHDTVYVRISETQKVPLPNILVGVSLGPTDSDIIRTIIGDLPLLS